MPRIATFTDAGNRAGITPLENLVSPGADKIWVTDRTRNRALHFAF